MTGPEVTGEFVTLDGGRYLCIRNVDRLAPFLMNVVSDSDVWLFVGSNGPFTAGRHSAASAVFPYQTVDKLLRRPDTSGAATVLLAERDGRRTIWEPWRDGNLAGTVTRNLYKHVDDTTVVFEEIHHELELRFRWSLRGCDGFGLVRRVELANLGSAAVDVRYLDGWHRMLPPGVDQATFERLSYLATAYMRHEAVPGSPLAIYGLNTAISDRPEPSESLRVAVAWSVGHDGPDAPVVLLSERQVDEFRLGRPPRPEAEVRGEMGAHLVASQVELPAGGTHRWYTVADTRLDHAAVVELREFLARPACDVVAGLEAAIEANGRGIRRRIAGADGLQHSADEAATAHHRANTLFNAMRGGTFDLGYAAPRDDVAAYVRGQSAVVFERHEDWIASLPDDLTVDGLADRAAERRDPQLDRILGSYLPLSFSRRHGDPTRPWNRFTIRLKDEAGRPVRWYEGNWRDIFQNWEGLARSYPGYLSSFVATFLNASTADGYNPYRITRGGIDWEVEDPADPWSHIGYWGDHQIVYLLRLLEALEAYQPGRLGAGLAERRYAYANVPYRIAGLDGLLRDPRHTITFDAPLSERLVAESRELGADAKLVRRADGEVRLVSLAEKLLLPLLVKLSNLVPEGGVWLNTQRPEWNDANNALAGWGLSVVTVGALWRYAAFLSGLIGDDEGALPMLEPTARLLDAVEAALRGIPAKLDDVERRRALVDLGRAGEAHRRAVYNDAYGAEVAVPRARVRGLLDAALAALEQTIRANRRPDGLYDAYNILRMEDDRAVVEHLGPMLEGQVAVLESGLLTADEAVELTRSLRRSAMLREDQHSYLLYPDHEITPFLERNTLAGEPPLADPRLFTRDRNGAWHFQADLATVADVEQQLDAAGAGDEARQAVVELWKSTFGHREFTGRSGRFFMFEGLGCIFWHMAGKLLVAVGGAHRAATDPGADPASAAVLADAYDDIREGMGFRKSPAAYGAFPTDPHTHSPRHMGAQQPGMTGGAKEGLLARFTELGVEMAGGRLRFAPRLLHLSEFARDPYRFDYPDLDGGEREWDLPAGSLAFTCCGVPVCYRLGDEPSIRLHLADGTVRTVVGAELGREDTEAIGERRGTVERLTVSVPRGSLRQ